MGLGPDALVFDCAKTLPVGSFWAGALGFGLDHAGNVVLARERQTEVPVARLAPVADERADRIHRAFVERRHAVQVEAQRTHVHRDVAADAPQGKSVGAGETAGEVEGGRAVAHFERVEEAIGHRSEPR